MDLKRAIARYSARRHWRRKQQLAGDSRFYGDGGTIHSTGHVDVETRGGLVVGVWFRCQQLPFRQVLVDEERARSMRLSQQWVDRIALTGVEVRDQ